MEIRVKKCKSGNVWKLVNESWSNSNGWGHKTTVIRNSYSYDPHKVRYHNRTWEMYTYQTCMSGAISTIYVDELRHYVDNYKYTNNIDRFKPGEKEKVIEAFNKTDLGQDLFELEDTISNNQFSKMEVE